jgi:hypothetical protein
MGLGDSWTIFGSVVNPAVRRHRLTQRCDSTRLAVNKRRQYICRFASHLRPSPTNHKNNRSPSPRRRSFLLQDRLTVVLLIVFALSKSIIPFVDYFALPQSGDIAISPCLGDANRKHPYSRDINLQDEGLFHS